jgi:hypothetical protein
MLKLSRELGVGAWQLLPGWVPGHGGLASRL